MVFTRMSREIIHCDLVRGKGGPYADNQFDCRTGSHRAVAVGGEYLHPHGPTDQDHHQCDCLVCGHSVAVECFRAPVWHWNYARGKVLRR